MRTEEEIRKELKRYDHKIKMDYKKDGPENIHPCDIGYLNALKWVLGEE